MNRGMVTIGALLRSALGFALALHGDDAASTHRAIFALAVDQFKAHIVGSERAEVGENRHADRLADLDLAVTWSFNLERDIIPVLAHALLPLNQLARQTVGVGVDARAEGESGQVKRLGVLFDH